MDTKRRKRQTKRKINNSKSTNSDTKIRRAEGSLDHMAIVKDYIDGELTVSEMAAKHQTSEENIGLVATRAWKALTNMKESRALMSTTGGENAKTHFEAEHALKALRNTDLINKAFLDLLSPNDTALLSDSEAIYCWHLVHSGEPRESLKASGLDVGLIRDKKRETRYSFDQALILRSQYLNAKPNVAAYITQLREERMINADVGRSLIQTELIDQLEQMKASPDPARYRTQILRTIELLGKTVGAFVDRVEVSEVNPSNALDELIEMAKDAEIKEIPESVEVTQ